VRDTIAAFPGLSDQLFAAAGDPRINVLGTDGNDSMRY
jgi:hypothetical protein